MPNYRIVCLDKRVGATKLVKIGVTLGNVKSLARYLNGLVRRRSDLQVLTCYVEDKDGKHIANMRFLQSEYAAQRWLTGYSERLLATAIEIYGMELKWNSGLKPVALVIREGNK